MIKPVRRDETWHRPARTGYPDPVKMLGYVWPRVEELRGTPREEWPRPEALAEALVELARYFEEAGWDDLALRTHHEVLEFRRELGDTEQLRRVLTALRDNLMRHERYEEALAVTQEELPLAQRLAVPGRYSTEIANVARYWITNLLGKLGRHAEAAENAREAIEEVREQQEPIEHASPPGYRLAHAHSEYARRLRTIGEYERAAGAMAEAASFWRRHDAPLNCHTAFDELSLLQLRLGRFEDARASSTEAVEALRHNTDWTSRDNLAAALHNHGNRLHDLGLFPEAVETARESVDRYRELLAEAERPALVMKMRLRVSLALVSLGSRLHDVGRLDESLAASDEAVTLATGDRDLARAWTNRASLLITLGSHAAAAQAAAKGIDLYPTEDGKAMARNTFALASAHAGDLDAALEASLQAVAHYREQHAEDPYEYAYLLADALTDHAVIRGLRSEPAQDAITESLALNEELAARHPARYQRELDRARSVACG
ncbi:hypothetical protein ACFWN2_09900 [Lentzea sp. NPDC058436]|uniref:hypothetical protein n=1 Tax=Lentzea sp. NPDC058436 TaxID=3346499 RepID=UPI00366A0837